jgi:hypothetical protein
MLVEWRKHHPAQFDAKFKKKQRWEEEADFS